VVNKKKIERKKKKKKKNQKTQTKDERNSLQQQKKVSKFLQRPTRSFRIFGLYKNMVFFVLVVLFHV